MEKNVSPTLPFRRPPERTLLMAKGRADVLWTFSSVDKGETEATSAVYKRLSRLTWVLLCKSVGELEGP